MKKIVFVLWTILIGGILTFGQTPTGRLIGIVSGPDGVLPGASVVVKFNTTGKTQTAVTNGDGSITFDQLEPGLYTVTITSNGFKTFTANGLKIDIGRDYNLTPTLEIGSVQENVTITAGADVVTSTSAQVTNVVSSQQILSLPLVTRDPLNLTTLQAGTASNPFQGTSINGMRTTATNITRDGISINDPFIRTNATDFAPGRPSVDDTGEFTISTSNQEADSGSGGAQITLVTPRGTKDLHGALFAYNRNSSFAANNFFNNRSGIARPFRNRNQYGGKIGGTFPTPHFGEGGSMFQKNKGFYFFAFEGIKDPVTSRTTRTILTPSARAGTFTFNRASAGDPINSGGVSCPSGAVSSVCTVSNILTFAQGQGFAGIPSTINPVIQQRVLSLLPTQSNQSGIGDGLNTAGYGLNRAANTTRNTYTGRIDLEATDKDSLSGTYSFNREDVLRPDVDLAGFTAQPDVTQFSANKTLSIAYRRIFSNTIVNEVRFGRFTNVVPFDRIPEYPTYNLGPSGTTSNGSLLAGIISNPEDVFLDQGRENRVLTFADNLNWVVGKHSLRFGGQYQAYNVNSYNDAFIIPFYSIGTTSVSTATNTTLATTNFANTCTPSPCTSANASLISATQLGTANGLLALLGGLVNGASQSYNTSSPTSGFQTVRQLAPFRNWNHSIYASDRWSVARGLTLSLGLRYELYPALKLDNGLALEPVISDPKNPAASLLAGNGTYNIIGTNAGKQYRYYKTDKNNFAPSIGVAYTPHFESGIFRFLLGSEGKTVLRGGYSQVYTNDSIITSLSNTLTSGASGNAGLGRTAATAVGPSGTSALNDRLGGTLTPVPAPTFIPPPRTFLQNNTNAFNNFGNASAVDPNLQVPKVEQYSFGIQREFGATAVEVRYVGTRSRSLARGVNLNQIDILSNGFLDDFKRAQANLALTGTTAFCNPATTTGCQTLSLFTTGTGATKIGNGPLIVGTTLTATTFNARLRDGAVADLAQSFVAGALNNQPTLANPSSVPFVKFYPNPNTGVIELFTNSGYYHYNSLQMEVRRRLSRGLYMQANYTYSKNITNAIGTSQALFEPYLQNQNQALDNQRADYDQTHAFNFNGIYQLPFGKGKMFLNRGGIVDKVLGGWEVSGIVQLSSGAPITFVDTRGTLNRGTYSGRQTPNSNLTTEQIRKLQGVFFANGNIYFINPSVINPVNGQASNGYVNADNSNALFQGQAFFNVEAGTTGTAARTTINGPRVFNTNMALLKNINFGETMRVQLRAEAFNLFNSVTFFNNTQFANINSSSFGQITSAAAARQFQFAARFEF